ncbi:MAG: GTP 3',8-cyclase MoaA [Clostridiales bacterium]|nr:GTP 3',8-cyclase MoaA [Clostridiales bacterium]
MKDGFGREINYMRVSITDRCDLRCRYCMPEGCEKVSMSQILTYEEIVRICRAASELGINRIKITGGEPFVRLGCTDLIRSIKSIEGIKEVTVTTNGQTLERYIDELKEIGIDGINISLDTLDPERYAYITGRGDLDKTLRSIGKSARSGIKTKINCLLQKDFNEDELYDFAELAFTHGIDVRFIEMMPVGAADAGAGLSNQYVLNKLLERWSNLEPDGKAHGNGPAVYYKRPGAQGGIGLISAIHGKFCGSCNRVRLTSQGQLKPCLSFDTGTDLTPALKGTDDELKEAIRNAILNKPEGHSFGDKENKDEHAEHRLMSQIGG